MEIEKDISLNKYFSPPVQYQVPLYQRRYIWNIVNWEALWRDILNQLDLELIKDVGGKLVCQKREQPKETPNLTPDEENNKKHFTGIIVTRPIRKDAFDRYEVDRYEVVDGQQRLTTFQIILCVIRDIFQSEGHVNQAIDANELIVNTEADVERDPDVTYKFIPIAYDKDEFEVVAKKDYGSLIYEAFDETAGSIDSDKLKAISHRVSLKPEDLDKNVLKVYNRFYEWIWVYMGKGFDFAKLDALLEIIKGQFIFAILILDRGDKSEEIFESLNATGQMLSDFDYLRNNLFLRARNLGVDEDKDKDNKKSHAEIFYRNYWHYFDKKENRSYWTTERLDEFFRVFLKAKLGPNCFDTKNVKPYEVYRRYSKGLKDGIEGIKDEFSELREWAESYENLERKQVFKDYKNFCDYLNFRDLNSFLLFVKHVDSPALSDIIWILESYIVRRMLVLESPTCNHAQIKKESYDNIISFFSDIVKGDPFSKELFVTFLNNTCPDDTQVMGAFRLADSKNADFIEYVFRKIKEWEREKQRYSMHRLPPLNLSTRVNLSTEIQNRLVDPEKLNEVFNEIWAPLLYFI